MSLRHLFYAVALFTVCFQTLTADIYIKGPIDVARCRASCAQEFLPLVTITDSSCLNNPNCNMCWQTCNYLFENYFLWVDMCNNYIICLPGCRQACSYWNDAKSAGMPGSSQLDVGVQGVGDVVLFEWSRPTTTSAHIVYVLRAFDYHRTEWIVLEQTVDNSCSIRKHYIDETYRYQLVAVTQNAVISLTNLHVDLTSATQPLNNTQQINLTTNPHRILSSPPSKTITTPVLYTALSVAVLLASGVGLFLTVRRLRVKRQAQITRGCSITHRNSLSRRTNSCSGYMAAAKDIVIGDNIAPESCGYTLATGYYHSIPIYSKSVRIRGTSIAVSQQLLIDISKFSHLGKHTHFLSITAVVKECDFIMLAVERMLQYTTLTHYLRSCYNEGDITDDVLYSSITSGSVTLRTNLIAQELLNIIHQLAMTMECLADLGYIHKCLTADHVIIDPVTKQFKLVDPDLSTEILFRTPTSTPMFFMAPEVIKGEGYTTRSDVWSFGMMTWQILMFGAVPLTRFEEQELYMWLCSAYRPPTPPTCSSGLYDLMLTCWSIFPEQRPSFSDITEQFMVLVSDGEIHYRLLSLAVSNQYMVKTCKSFRESTVGSSPALIQSACTAAFGRACLPSNPRLDAVSDATILSPDSNLAGDDDVFDDCQENASMALLPGEPGSLVRSKSAHSRGSSRRRKTSGQD